MLTNKGDENVSSLKITDDVGELPRFCVCSFGCNVSINPPFLYNKIDKT